MSRSKKIIKKIIAKAGYNISKHPAGNQLQGSIHSIENYLKHIEGDTNYYETPIGNYFLPNNAPDDIVINAMKAGQYFEPHIIAIAEKYIKPGTSVLDIGANLGQMSIHFSKLAGPAGKVYSFDADDYIFEFLLKNIKANNCSNIEPIFGAVYYKAGETLFFPKQDFIRFASYGSYGINPNAEEGREVKTITIDSLVIQEPIGFMKVDVQGSDLFALHGAEQTIRRNKMPIIFEFEQQFQKEFKTTFQDYVEFVDHISYRFVEIVRDVNYLLFPKENI